MIEKADVTATVEKYSELLLGYFIWSQHTITVQRLELYSLQVQFFNACAVSLFIQHWNMEKFEMYPSWFFSLIIKF